MANEKISELTPTWSPWISDIIPIAQGWVNKQAELWDLISISTATQTALNTKQNLSYKWQPNWLCLLDWSWKSPNKSITIRLMRYVKVSLWSWMMRKAGSF